MANLDDERAQEVQSAFTKLAGQVWADAVTTGLTKLTMATANILFEGVSKSLVNYEVPDHVAIAQIRANVFAFSHAKSLTEMKALSNLVVGKDKIKSFSEFETAAAKIGDKFNRNYLKTEYETVVASGQMARRYLEVTADKEVFPLLQWDAVNDGRTRPEHRRLDRVILPADDPFWKSYWPPIGYGCRCDVRQLRSGRVTPKANAYAKAKQTVNNKSPFIGNSVVDGEVFGINHPYIGGKKTAFDLKPNQYGLKPLSSIYSKSGLPKLKQGFNSKQEWQDHFADLYKKLNGKDGNITITDALDRPLLINSNVIGTTHSKPRYDLGGSLLDVLQNPDEVYSNYHKGSRDAKKLFGYKYIKFYAGKPVVVVVSPDGNNMRVRTIYDATVNKLGKDRKGILHHVDRF